MCDPLWAAGECLHFLSFETCVVISDLTSYHKISSRIALSNVGDQGRRLNSYRSLSFTCSVMYVMILSRLLSSSMSLMFMIYLFICSWITLTFEIGLWCLANLNNLFLYLTTPSDLLLWSILFEINRINDNLLKEGN